MKVDSDSIAAYPSQDSEGRKRTPRVSGSQLDALLTILKARPYLYTRKFAGIHGRDNFYSGWQEIAVQLNQLPNGSVKTPKQWMTVWRDFKSRACLKAARLQKEKEQPGNHKFTTAPLTEVERRIVSLIGIETSDCPDSTPEDNTIPLQTETGMVIGELMSLRSQCNEIEFIKTEREEASPEPEITESGRVTAVSPSYTEHVQEPTRRWPTIQIPLNDSGVAATAVLTPPPTVHQKRFRRYKNLNPHRSVSDSLNCSFHEHFLTVAESNAQSMKMLATATQLHAEAAKKQAEAAKVQAEAFLLLAQAVNKIGDTLLQNKNS